MMTTTMTRTIKASLLCIRPEVPAARRLKTAQSDLNDLGEPEGSRIQI